MINPEEVFADKMRDTIVDMIRLVASGKVQKQAVTITVTPADDDQVNLKVEFDPEISTRRQG